MMDMKATKLKSAMPSTPPAGDDGPQLIPRRLTWEPVMPTGMRVTMAMMQMLTRWKKHHNPKLGRPTMWRNEGIIL